MSKDTDLAADLARAPKEIAAEAMSEYARGPSYEELWRPRRVKAPPAPRRRSRPPLSLGIVAALIGATGLIGLREKVVRVAPPLAGAYASLGMPVNLVGLELRDLRSRIVLDGARKVLAIEGEIVNLRRDSTPVPPVALVVRGGDGQDRYGWTARAPKTRLEAGEKIAFRARLASPPEDGADVLARFAARDEEKKSQRQKQASLDAPMRR